MNLITTKLDVSTVVADGFTKSKIDGIPTELSPDESIELVRVESDKRFGFVEEVTFALQNNRLDEGEFHLNLLRSSITPKDDSTNDYDYAPQRVIESYISTVESALASLESDLLNINFDLSSDSETVCAASSLGWALYYYIKRGTGIFVTSEHYKNKIDCLANLFKAPLSEDKLFQFMSVLIEALHTSVLRASHRDRKDLYQELAAQYVNDYDPGVCYFDERQCNHDMFAVRMDEGYWIIFDPEISELQKQQ